MKSKYLQYFCDGKNQLESSCLRTIKNHIANYEDLEELLGFQYYLNHQFKIFSSKTADTELRNNHKAGLYIHSLFFYNIQSFQSALYSLECDLIHSAANNLRTIQEAIPKMYYMSLFPEQVGRIMVHEEIHMKKYGDALKELQEKNCQEYLNGEVLKFPKKHDFQIFKRKYMPKFFRDALYDEERKCGIDGFYGTLSNSSHANITRNRTSVEYTYENTETFFEFLLSLSWFNIESFLECNYDLLNHLNLIKESIDFLNMMAAKFKTIMSGVYFIPNKDNLHLKLKLQPIHR